MKFGFLIKSAMLVALVVLFDWLFPGGFAGAAVGIFAAAWLGVVMAVRGGLRVNRSAWVALGAAAIFAIALFYDPGPLSWAMFWAALSMAALLPQTGRFDDAWHWGGRLILHALTGLAKLFADIRRVVTMRRAAKASPRAIVAVLALPLIGGALFVTLFATANPLIAQALAAIRLPTFWRLVVWTAVAVAVWPSLRPHPAVMRLAARIPHPEPTLPGTSLTSVLIALGLFNIIFAIQNGLDIAFLWSGGPLPAGMTQTEYVHRGAYPLIVTALIAGAMALAMLRPGSPSERHPWARRLVTLWVVQNLVLVASSAMRTIDYIETSMLTAWRIAALIWMALVALGLVLICIRILGARSGRWLINWNAAAAAVVLSVCSFFDLGAFAAAWNVQAPRPDKIDLCYLHEVGDGALLPLIRLEQQPMDAATLDRVRAVRADLQAKLEARRTLWSGWTPRGAHLLAEARALQGTSAPQPAAIDKTAWRNCDGSIGLAGAIDADRS
jgi:hypothetical protein